jgi:pilus assembly protein FimV
MPVNQTLRHALAIALAMAASPAFALGLGQIQVKSRPGQPLLAEIPIVSSDPAELQGLQVQLASPDTFRRIGLEPPQGDVSALRFEPAIDERGRPVIRITSPTPVQQPLLTFLVEVDWSGGRLVREYSALVETPRTVAAPTQPAVEAPVVAEPNVVAPPAAGPTPLPPPASTSAAPSVATTPTRVPTPAPAAEQPAPTPTSTPAPRPAPPPEPRVATATRTTATAIPKAPAPSLQGSYRVRSGDTLAGIAGRLGGEADSLDQAMLALLRTNPDAFIDGNINRLKAGAVLRTPTADELSRITTGEAAALVHEQIAGWRQARKPVVQPGATTAPAAAAAPHAAKPPQKPTAVASRDARLEIVPPSSGRGRQAGSQSGLEAGGEGDMLRQQLQESRETLAARDAEVRELKARVAELEKIQQDQQQLIQMKSSALAAAQQNLAKANTAATSAAPVPAATQAKTQAQTAQPKPATPPASSNAGPWLWSGIGLVLLAVLGWWFTRRREPAPVPSTTRRFDTAALAASVPVAEEEPTVADFAPVARRDNAPSRTSAPPPQASRVMPSWVANGLEPAAPTGSAVEAETENATPRNAAEQLDLAQAYLDVGDEEAARTLLREVLAGRDPVAREAAARLLREL